MADHGTFKPTSPDLRMMVPSRLDPRSDKEIAAYITTYRPVASTKNVWAFWDKGWDALQGWKQRNVISWVRRLGRSWEVRVLDSVPDSVHNATHFVSNELLPDAFKENRMTGKHVGQHSADLVRLPLLYEHGGVWLDVGFFLFRDLDDICWNAISGTDNPDTKICGARYTGAHHTSMVNGFIGAMPSDPFILNWHKIFLALWQGRTELSGVHNHPLIRPFAVSTTGKQLDDAFGTTDLTDGYITDYIAHMVCLDKLLATDDPATGFCGATYWRRHFRLLPISEIFPLYHMFDRINGFTEERSAELLALKRIEPVPRDDQEQLDAERLVEGALAHASLKKLSSGPWRSPLETVAGRWDVSDGDITPGTWAAYLRWGSVHLEQTRQLSIVEAETSAEEGGTPRKVYRVGFLEPIVRGKTPLVQGSES